jgi:hypothetical protein
MGAREMQQAAKKYLEKVSGNEALMERVQKLEAANAELVAREEARQLDEQSKKQQISDADTQAKRGGAPLLRNGNR